jgi:hypothetical protein
LIIQLQRFSHYLTLAFSKTGCFCKAKDALRLSQEAEPNFGRRIGSCKNGQAGFDKKFITLGLEKPVGPSALYLIDIIHFTGLHFVPSCAFT